MAVTLTIGGVSKRYEKGTLSIPWTANFRPTARLTVRSMDGTYHPQLDDEVIVMDGSDTLFGGLISSASQSGILGEKTGAYEGIFTTINAVGYYTYAERRVVNATIAAGTLKSQLQYLITNQLGVYGITLDAGQVDGPTMPAWTCDYQQVADLLKQIMTATAGFGDPYIWAVSPTKVLSAFQPSSSPAPFDIADGDGNTIGDIISEPSNQKYFNRVFVKIPVKTQNNRVETFTGDGSTTAFPLQYTPTTWTRGLVNNNGSDETLGTTADPGGATWIYDNTTNTLTRNSAPANGNTISFEFNGSFGGFAYAEDPAVFTNPWEVTRVVDSVPDNESAQSIADGLLAQAIALPTTIKYKTYNAGLVPGMTQHITSTLRNLDTDAIITSVNIRDYGTGRLIRDVTLTSGTNPQDDFRDTYKRWNDTGGSAATTAVTTGTGTTKIIAPAPPTTAVQFNDAGAFGGSVAFTWNKTTNSLIAGGGDSSITATGAESCFVLGYDCHITDPA